jgi:hypothetical protein
MKLPPGIGTNIPLVISVDGETSAVNTMFSYSGAFLYFIFNYLLLLFQIEL